MTKKGSSIGVHHCKVIWEHQGRGFDSWLGGDRVRAFFHVDEREQTFFFVNLLVSVSGEEGWTACRLAASRWCPDFKVFSWLWRMFAVHIMVGSTLDC